jgi:hypothetical protein
VFSQLQQELNYRYLQQGSERPGNGGAAAFSAPHSQPSNQQASVGGGGVLEQRPESCRPHQVKWCAAHVTIARQILLHQQQAKTVLEMASRSGLHTEAANPPTTTSVAPPTSSLDPAQQIALFQMYGVPSAAIPGGYMTVPGVPYPSLPPEVQLHNLSFVPNTAPTALFMDAANVLSLKPLPGMTTQASDSSTRSVPMMNGVQLLPYATAQSLPMAAVMPGVGVSSAMSGPYIGSVPVPVVGNCVLNPCQPGVMAAPWVR